MKTEITVTLLVALCCSRQIGAEALPTANQKGTENAAVKYLRADAALRQAYALAPDAAAKLQKALESPLDAEDEKLVAAAAEALVEFHHGAAIQRCDWDMSVEDGALANTAHRGAVIELVAVSGLRARLRFREGDISGGIDDALAAMATARHLSVDGSLASVLFSYRLEKTVAGIVSGNLERFSAEQLKELSRGYAALPKGYDLGQAFEAEKVRRNDFAAIAQGATSRDELVERLLKGVPVLDSNKERAVQIVEACGGSVEGFAACIRGQQSFYTSWAPRFSLPPEQFEKEFKVEIEQPSEANPLIKMFTPSLPRFRWVEAYMQTHRALFRAAVAVRIDGRGALNQYPDPYNGNPFIYTSVSGGFRLESRLQENGVPLSVSVVLNSEDRRMSPN